jgi:hypothetical protein
VKVCLPVQVLAFPRLSEATTPPKFGEMVRVPSAFVTEVTRPRLEVAVSVYPPVEFPTNICPKVGAVESPVPPYATEMVEEAETTPLIAWRGPVREPMVTPPLKTLEAE